MIQDFKDLSIYRRSYKAAIDMYEMVKVFPREELFGLTSQIKRASTSVPLNIAEGYGKKESPNEFKRFLMMSMGSCNEMRVLLEMSKDLGFIDEAVQKEYDREYDELGRMINSLRVKWK